MTLIKIRPVKKEDHKEVYKFQCKYSEKESFEKFKKRVRENSSNYLCAFDKKILVGICYGQPSKFDKKSIQLQGIAVHLEKNM